ncbi:LUD domain-containing protein [Halorubrum cibi]|uniref:L-lactate utilization protein LutB, contains a ferredoxin-type domain n=1 Tax=Halorubrum cibi TaxID=413815 RepID=A0A521CGN9_9EURY|nr:LUD domain-containing protein [Halorubrum cibi]SMO58562.1 L-lactate utilization protein LutB, contains a ferredoxin-type domain [Halorubrum cibi]
MSADDRRAKAERIRHLLDTEGDSVQQNTRVFNDGRYESTADLEDYEELKDEARAIKEDAIERLPELLDRVTESVESNGGTVYVADDADDANRYIEEVVDGRNVVKSKSMTTEEIDVNDALEADGAGVWETDLAEFVLQVADEAPSHIVAPAVHKSREEIADLFNEVFEPDEPLETAEELTRFAREYLGERILDAEVGMTGANFVAAETGTLALVTSEGNARKCVQATDTHVAVAGVEKIVPSVEDLQPFVELIGRSGTGQDITSYVSLFTPPGDSPTFGRGGGGGKGSGSDGGSGPDGPGADDDRELESGDDREFHLVLIDNGRMEMREDDDLRETLYCIRCSACANSCANFQHVGGHAFGGETYSGGIATGWEAGVHGQNSAAEFNDLCTGCSRCVNQCPVKIDIPWINTVVRDRINRGSEGEFDFLVEGLTPDEEPGGIDLQKRLFGNFDALARLGSAFAPLSNRIARSGPARSVMERTLGVDGRRDLPTFERESLVDWFADRGSRVGPDEARRTVALYPDAYTNYVRTERGKATVRVLESLGVRVEVPAAGESGRAPLSQGMVATARSNAEAVYEALSPAVAAGHDVVVIEPSDLAMFHREYERLLPEDAYDALKGHSYEVMEYVYGLLENGADVDALSAGDGERVAYHSHCQQRTLDLEPYTLAVLEESGFDVVTSDVECCGMAGSFGYKSEYYELSVDVGETLVDQFSTDDAADRTVVASGTSCLEQLDALLTRRPAHPVRLLDGR